jgi:two-component system chemotaxis response regulator CheY
MPPASLKQVDVMIVDDERLIQNLVTNVLTSLGFSDITVANSGRKAIDCAMVRKFDFIITDWRMGDMDGIDLVRHVRQNRDSMNHRTPIIMLTGNTEAYYVKTAITSGVNGYLLKPFSAEQLVKRIRNVIETPRDFVMCRKYAGPDRRHAAMQPPEGVERRKARKK